MGPERFHSTLELETRRPKLVHYDILAMLYRTLFMLEIRLKL